MFISLKNDREGQKTYNNALQREIHLVRHAFFCLFELNEEKTRGGGNSLILNRWDDSS